jgi:hypothetical protein
MLLTITCDTQDLEAVKEMIRAGAPGDCYLIWSSAARFPEHRFTSIGIEITKDLPDGVGVVEL